MAASDGDRRLTLTIEDPRSQRARALLGAYLGDVVSRYYGRPLTDAEMTEARGGMPGDDLAEPLGVLLIARLGHQDAGCVGMRFVVGDVGEITSLFVLDSMRRQGIGTRLLDALERIAAERGLSTLRLDTRHDLVEARRLYARHAFREVPAFNDEPHAEHWFAKALSQSAG